MKVKNILFAAMAAATIALPAAYADTPGTMAGTTNSTDAMTALFGVPVIAKGTGVSIKQSDLDQVISGIKSAAAERGEDVSAEQMTQLKAQMLERLIDIQLLLQKANDADNAAGVKKANDAMATLHERAGSQETLDMQLKAAGTTEAQLRTKVTQEATAMAALQRVLSVAVTPDDVNKFYNDHPADFEQPEMAHVRHILLMTMDPVTRTPLTADQQKAKQKQAADLLKQIRGGADFATLAKQYSEDPGSKDNGGEMPPFPRGQMVPEFEAAAFSLTNNQVSDIVTSTYGYHIIKMIDKTPAKKLALTDKVPSGDATIDSKVKELLMQQKADKIAPAYLDKLKQAADVQILDPDLKAAMDAAAAAAAAAPAAPPEQ